MELTKRQLSNFWKKVNVLESDQCWEWIGSLKPQGYGQLTLNRKLHYAHRVSWQISNNQDIPKGMQILHSCDNRKCVNPNHLWLGTQKDNIQDMVAKGRCNPWDTSGENHPMAKLSEDEVRAIRLLYNTGKYTCKDISEKFPISKEHAWKIATNKIWRHIK